MAIGRLSSAILHDIVNRFKKEFVTIQLTESLLLIQYESNPIEPTSPRACCAAAGLHPVEQYLGDVSDSKPLRSATACERHAQCRFVDDSYDAGADYSGGGLGFLPQCGGVLVLGVVRHEICIVLRRRNILLATYYPMVSTQIQ